MTGWGEIRNGCRFSAKDIGLTLSNQMGRAWNQQTAELQKETEPKKGGPRNHGHRDALQRVLVAKIHFRNARNCSNYDSSKEHVIFQFLVNHYIETKYTPLPRTPS